MQTLTRPKLPTGPSLLSPRRRKRFSPFMLIGVVVTVIIAIGAGVFLVSQSRAGSHAAGANVNMDCTLIVPPNPLSATGLSTPWQLTATNLANGPCNMANGNQATFVQGAVLDPATGQISIYNPLVVDQGTQPAAPPVVPTLPANAVVALWGGSNANNVTLQGADNNALQNGNCVNGSNGSLFGQYWYCNAPTFFAAANKAIQQGQLKIPALGTAKDGMPCPTVSDFSVVDMDPHDNVTTTYLVTANGQTAQMNAKNVAALQGANPVVNGSDERLLAVALDGALGCTPWTASDLADPGNMVPALPLNELQAAALQAAPQALIPNRDPMVLVNNARDMNKLNLYRAGVDEPQVQNFFVSNTFTYCKNMLKIAPARIQLDAQFTIGRPSPDAGAANNLATFLAQRFVGSYENGLNCVKLTGQADTIKIQTDNNGVAIGATINGVALGGGSGGGGNGGGGSNGAAPNCVVNGTNLANCAGTTTINGQNCTFSFANNTVNVTCGAAAANQVNNAVNGQAQQNASGQQPQVQPGGLDGGKGKRVGNGNPTGQP